MKRIILNIFLLSILTRCTDDLNQVPISEASTANFYLNETDMEQAVNSIYEAVAGPSTDYGYPDLSLYLSEVRSDVMYGVGEAGVRDWEPINNFSAAIAGNTYLDYAWANNYLAIFRANIVLEELSETNVEDDDLREQFEGEARFLRAFCYFDLIRLFGRVPLVDKVMTLSEVLNVERSEVSDVYDLVISDLETAISLLPGSYESASLGRATSHAARGILARVYLTRSGPTYSIDGPGLATSEYGDALTLLDEIIANSDGISFVDDYADIFAYDNENSAEVIFDIQYQSGQLGIGGTYPGNWVPSSYFSYLDYPFAIGLEIIQVSDEQVNLYDAGDDRLDVCLQVGFNVVSGSDSRTFMRKWLEEDGYGEDRFNWPINYIVLRYTDVLMMKAECILQGASGTQTEVDDIVNQVRTRAGLSDLTDVTLDDLLDERRREFAGECLRWHDLVRTGNVLTTMEAWIDDEDDSGQMSAPTADMIIYPVPQSQIDVKTGLYDQNPGY